MARDNATNPDILDYIESLCWELFMIFGEQQQNIVDWQTLSGAYEQQYIALQKGRKTEKLLDIDDIYSKVSRIIEDRYQKDRS